MCTVGRASRQKDEEYISIRSLLSNSSPFGIPPFLLFPPHPSSLSLSRGFLEEEIASKSTLLGRARSDPRSSNHRFLFSRERSPRWDGPTKSNGGVSRIFFVVWSRRFCPAFEFVCSRGIILYLRTWCFILYRYCAIVIYSQWRGIRFFSEIEILSFKYIKDEDTHNSV